MHSRLMMTFLSAAMLLPMLSLHTTAASRSSIGWASAAPLPVARVDMATAVGHDGNVYVFGGGDGVTYDSNATFVYHPRTDTWSVGTTMPIATAGASAVTLPDGRIAVIGGGTGCHGTLTCTIYNTVQVYSPKTHAWCLFAPMHASRYRFAAVLGPDGRIYAIGGWNGTAPLASVEAYNVHTNKWSFVSSLPQAEMNGAAVVTHGRIAMMGGYNGTTTNYNDLFVYNGHTWESGSPLPTARSGLGAAVDAHGRIITVGGFNQSGYLSTVEIYDPRNDTWSQGTPFPQALSLASAVTVPGGKVYVLGGWHDHAFAQMYVYGAPIAHHNPFTS